MPKRLPKDVDKQVLAHVANSPDGLGIEALSRLLGDQISRRSPQRRLSDLVATGRLISEKVYHPLEVPQLIEECFQQRQFSVEFMWALGHMNMRSNFH